MTGAGDALAAWGGAVRYHLLRRRNSTATLVVGGAAGGALSPAGSGGSGSALVLATGLLTLIHLHGAVGGEIRAGRAVLAVGAAGSVGGWLVRDGTARVAALGTALASMWWLWAALLLVRPGVTATLLDTVPFLALLAVVIASVAWALSAVAERLDGLLSAIYLVPVTLVTLGLSAGNGDPTHASTLLVVPVEALLTFAPAYGQGPEPPNALARIAGFVGVWTAVGTLGTRARIAMSGIWPRG